MSPQLEYLMVSNPTGFHKTETFEPTVIRIAEVLRDAESFAGIYYGITTGVYLAVFTYRVPAVFSDEFPYRMLTPSMGQDVTLQLTPHELSEVIAKMANLEYRPL